jgi:hypothetical protein
MRKQKYTEQQQYFKKMPNETIHIIVTCIVTTY